MKVEAIERGHCGRVVREIGDQFDVPDERLKDGSTWFVPVGQAPEPSPKPVESRPLGSGPTPPSTVNAARPPGAGPVAGSALQAPASEPASAPEGDKKPDKE